LSCVLNKRQDIHIADIANINTTNEYRKINIEALFTFRRMRLKKNLVTHPRKKRNFKLQ
jgi:hypothetical protein